VSLTGEDAMGLDAKKHLEGLGVDVQYIEQVPGESTGMYLSILNDKNDMELAICNMDIFKKITPAFLEERLPYLEQAEIVGVDCNLDFEALGYITKTLKTPLFLEPVSASKAERVKDIIGRFHTIKPNKIEAEMLSGMSIDSDEDLRKAARWFFDQGVKRVFISLSERGAYYKDEHGEGIVPPNLVELVSATGAGDAFSAAILYGHINGMSAREITEMGMACSSIAVETKTAVNPEMSMEKVRERMK
ncbi:MAG: bifunctional hydroxymethylpyrimidine kinase/phosphomethylpyrimidine kinase, partial [Firmicutes bacterium]|nr:bifunctional hydroxymethylpyrimidine kinase/phosphomethylpyrimidine kinase [Bacillota bacterium]